MANETRKNCLRAVVDLVIGIQRPSIVSKINDQLSEIKDQRSIFAGERDDESDRTAAGEAESRPVSPVG